MTREEAIQVLQTALTSPFIYGEYADAISMAIEALADRPTESDLISKAKVLETYSELYWFDSDCGVVSKEEVDKIYERLQSLPSAEVVLQTPQTYGKSINPNAEIVSDLISRQDAIDAIKAFLHNDDDWFQEAAASQIRMIPSADKSTTDCTEFIKWLTEVVLDEEDWRMNPDAYGEVICRKLKKLGLLDVEDGYYVDTRPTGEWGEYMVCSNCGKQLYDFVDGNIDGIEYEPNYCPNCGAKMVGEDGEA